MTNEKLNVPEKFINKEDGQLNTEALLRSYLELERKMGRKDTGLDVAASGRESFSENDEAVKKLREAGLTEQQIEAVYAIGQEDMMPFVYELATEIAAGLAQEYEAELEGFREHQKLVSHFGNEEKCTQILSQIAAWAQKNVRPEVMNSLGCSCEGVLALYRMMEGNEPKVSSRLDAEFSGDENLEDLRKMMSSQAYWRDRDPKVIQRVQEGFKRLYS